MLNIIENIILGILFFVIIYYINFLFGTLGKMKIPLLIAVWSPKIILIMILICRINIRINEK